MGVSHLGNAATHTRLILRTTISVATSEPSGDVGRLRDRQNLNKRLTEMRRSRETTGSKGSYGVTSAAGRPEVITAAGSRITEVRDDLRLLSELHRTLVQYTLGDSFAYPHGNLSARDPAGPGRKERRS